MLARETVWTSRPDPGDGAKTGGAGHGGERRDGHGLIPRLGESGRYEVVALDLKPLEPDLARWTGASIVGDILDRRLCLLLIRSASSNIERSAGLIDDGRHAHPHPHRPPPWCQDPALLGVREPRVTAPTGRSPAHRAAPTPADVRPAVVGPAVPYMERLDGCRLRRPPTRHRDPVAADRLQAPVDLEEPAVRARPPGGRFGAPKRSSAGWPRPTP